MKLAVYTGSFDPITLGHLNVIQRASRIADRLIVGIGVNIEKKGLFEPAERISLAKQVTAHIENVEVHSFEGLAVDFVQSTGAQVMVRGIRPLTDTAGEFTMMMANRKLNPDLETVFLMADGKFTHVSSSLIKQLTPLASDAQLSEFVPAGIITALREKLGHRTT